MDPQTTKAYPVNITLFGPTSVGKTSILDRFIRSTFDEGPPLTMATTFSTKLASNNNHLLLLCFQDTPGSDVYYELCLQAARKSEVVIIVITLDLFSAEYWDEEVRKKVLQELKEEQIIIVFCTKLDEVQNYFQKIQEIQKQIDDDKQYVHFNLYLHYGSSKNDEGINTMMALIIDVMVNRVIEFRSTLRSSSSTSFVGSISEVKVGMRAKLKRKLGLGGP